jgi:hypothetical protein
VKRVTMGTIFIDETLVAVGVDVDGAMGMPVVVLVAFEVWLPLTGGVLLTIVKFAQVMRVLLAKCRVMEPLPKNALEPLRVEAYSSV